MPFTKNSLIRYKVLDVCFSNTMRCYTRDDLLNEINEALRYHNPDSNGIKQRQLYYDIEFMKSELGYNAPIKFYRTGGYYRYSDANFTIFKYGINYSEAFYIKDLLRALKMFEGLPQFEWLEKLDAFLDGSYTLDNYKKIIGYENNIDYSGNIYIKPLFDAIANKRVLEIIYQPFGKDIMRFVIHPYYLKQYNCRWFLFGYNAEANVRTWNLALDRIQSIQPLEMVYKEAMYDFESHFYDIIGVTMPEYATVQEVKLVFSPEQADYIVTKPLHPTQKHKLLLDGSLEVRIQVALNYELEMQLLSYGEKVKVISPESLKSALKTRIEKSLQQYS